MFSDDDERGEDDEFGLDPSGVDHDAPILVQYGTLSTTLHIEPPLVITGNDTQEVSSKTLKAAVDAAQATLNEAVSVYEKAWTPPPGTNTPDLKMVEELRHKKVLAELGYTQLRAI